MSDNQIAVDQQPTPTTSNRASAHDLVIADLNERKAMGLKKYNTLLQPMNGRDSLVDAYQEVLDLAAYLRNEIAERQELRAEIRRLLDLCAQHGIDHR